MRTFSLKIGARRIQFSDRMIQENDERKWWIIPVIAAVYLLPACLDEYTIYLMNMVGSAIIGAVALDILCGFCGQLSLGHAAFIGIGAYSYGICHMTLQIGPILSLFLAGLTGAMVSLLIGIPSLRLKGLYLAIATMGFTFIVDEAVRFFSIWTHGVEGFKISRVIDIGAARLNSGETGFYYFIYTLVVIIVIFSRLLLHSKMGRAFTSIRDSDVAAEVSGINLLLYKVLCFAISSFFASLSGALMGIIIGMISPEDINIMHSINYLIMLVIGGMGVVYGAVIGAVLITFLPEWISMFSDSFLPMGMDVSIFQYLIFGLLILFFIVFEPNGVYGRWVAIKGYFKTFPFNERKIGRIAWIYRWR
jgi:branched-chain amino acid transport system permease protein